MFFGYIIYKGVKKLHMICRKMYVAKPLSGYLKNPGSLSLPPDGPNSGFLVIQDEEAETYSCFGLSKNSSLEYLPFPQNKALTLRDADDSNDVILIPVLNLPLSLNRYYAIQPRGKNHKGEAFTCSREEDKRTMFFCPRVQDNKPKPFDPRNVYQQFEIFERETLCVSKGLFYAKSVASDGYPPLFLRTKGWTVHTKTPANYKLQEAAGLNASLRAQQPDLNFPPSNRVSKAVVVGKWYTPFMFVKEGTLREQVKTSPFYQVTLEQKWERIFHSRNDDSREDRSVNLNVKVDAEMVYVNGNKAVWDEKNALENAIWFISEEARVGLAVELVQRMKWEQERGGWIGGRKGQVSVKRSEKFKGNGVWREFGCYVLVESFVFKRMDATASVALMNDFKHTQHIRSIWNQ